MSESRVKTIDIRINVDGLPQKTAKVQRRNSARNVLAMFLGVMKDCGYSATETKAALQFFIEPKP